MEVTKVVLNILREQQKNQSSSTVEIQSRATELPSLFAELSVNIGNSWKCIKYTIIDNSDKDIRHVSFVIVKQGNLLKFTCS